MAHAVPFGKIEMTWRVKEFFTDFTPTVCTEYNEVCFIYLLKYRNDWSICSLLNFLEKMISVKAKKRRELWTRGSFSGSLKKAAFSVILWLLELPLNIKGK